MKYLGKQSIFDDLMIGGVLLTPPDPATYSYELTLPNDDGTAGQILQTDGSGVLTWTTPAGGSGVTMTGGVDNRVMTASGAQSIQGEANFTFDGSSLALTGVMDISPSASAGAAALTIDNDDVDKHALLIEAANTTENILDIEAGALTTADAIHIKADALTSGGHVFVADVNDANTDNSDKSLIYVDYDKTGVTAATKTNVTTGLIINLTDSATNSALGAVEFTGAAIYLDAMSNQGTIRQTGYSATLTDADVADSIGYYSNVEDGGIDFKAVSSASSLDYFTIATGTNGATTFTTVDNGIGLDANLDFNIDGTVEIATASGKNITLDSGASVYLEGAIIQAEYSTSGVRIRDASASALYYSQINVTGIDGARIHTLPNATGTLALTSDIPAAYTLPLATTSVRGGVELGSDTDLTEAYQTGVTGASGKTYPVQLNAANQMGVSVPWTDNNTTYTAGDGLDLSGTTFSTDLKSNGGLVIESTELAVDLGASSITGTLAVGDGGTGLTTVGTNYMLTGNGTGALSAESLAQFNGSTGRMNVGLGLSQFEVGGWYSSGSPSAESPGSGSTMVLKTYNLGGTALPSLFKIAGSGQGGDEPQFRIEGGEANGTDKSGGDIHIIGGAGTGNETSGKFEFHGHPGGGGTGSSNNTTSVKFTIEPDGDVSMSGDLTVSGGDITLSGTGRIQGVDTVSASTDAASKGYVDGLIPTVPDEVVSAGTHILKQTKVTLSQANCNSLSALPIPLVAAQGANKIIIPVEVTCLVDRAAPDTSLGDLIVGWNGTTTYTYALKYARRWMYGILTDMTFVLNTYAGKGAASLTGGENVPLTIATSTGMTTNSLTGMTVYTSYYVIDNS